VTKTISLIFANGIFSRMVHFCSLQNLIFCLALLAATPAHSAASCSISMQNVAFGNVDVTPGTAVDTSATLQVTCAGSPPMGERLCISIGAVTGDDATSRKMTGPGSATIRYDLYTTAARTTVWGSWQTGYKSPGVQQDVANGTTSLTVYARLFGSQQSAASGSYTASFTANPFLQYRDKMGASACPVSGGNTTTTSTTFTASVTVLPSCTVSATNMDFGSHGFLTSNIDATSTVTVSCSTGAPYSVSLGNGNWGTSPTSRLLVGSFFTVTYGIYSDAARSVAWGSTIGTNTVGGTGTGAAQSLTAYGRVPSQTTPTTGTYTDSVVVTVTY
jgi:spore coat protein U-like protein